MTIELSEYVINAIADAVVKKMQEPSYNSIKTELEPSDDWVDVPSGEMTLEQARAAVKDLRKALAMEKGAYNALVKNVQCDDAVSRQVVIEKMRERDGEVSCLTVKDVRELPSVIPQQKIGHCKDCKYFEYDSVAKVHGIPLIIAHEICKRWSDGCKTSEDGYCFLFEPKMQEDKE